MSTHKKCPECNEWTSWNHQLTDKCEHCSELLDKRAINDIKLFEKQQKINEENSFYVPKPGDSFIVLAVRKAAWIANVIYVAMVSFMLWFFTTLAG